MALALLDRLPITKRHILTMLVALACAGWAIWYFDADRQLERGWSDFVDAMSSKNASALQSILSEDYSDRWGYSRDTIVMDARLAFQQLQHLELSPEHVAKSRTGERATIRAVIRVDAAGNAAAEDARVSINALIEPFVFEWRRDPSFPWSWRLVNVDHPSIDLARFRRAYGGF